MKKEIVFAISIGLIVGLIITFGMYRARQTLSGSTVENEHIENADATPTPSPANTPTVTTDTFLVSEPSDESLVIDPNVRVSGQTIPNDAIIILMGNTETVGTADNKGNFSLALTLQPGANLLTIRSLGENHEPREVTRTVVVSSTDLSASPSAMPVTKQKSL